MCVAPQLEQTANVGATATSCVRRLAVLCFECFRFGCAIFQSPLVVITNIFQNVPAWVGLCSLCIFVYRVLANFCHHLGITLAVGVCVHGRHGQRYVFVHVPRYIDGACVGRHCYVVGVDVVADGYGGVCVHMNGLLHLVEAAVARNADGAVDDDVQIDVLRHFLRSDGYFQRAFMVVARFDGRERIVVYIVFKVLIFSH